MEKISKLRIMKTRLAGFLLLCAMLGTGLVSKASPTAYFSSNPRSGCAPLLVHFYNASAPGSYLWNFGDPVSGVNDTSTACGPSHIYNTPGTHIVTLTVITGSGTFTHTDTITVLPTPTPNITGSHGVCIGSTSAYSVGYSAGSTYTWVVNGGNYTTNTNGNIITVTWLAAGNGDITVSETNSSGCKGIDTFNVYVAPLPHPAQYLPCMKAGSNGDPKGGCVCEHSVSTYIMPDNGDSYQWYVTNGTILPPGSTSNVLNVQWGTTGQASVMVVVTNIYGCKDSAKCIFDICPGPHASFTANNACLGNPTSFNDLASVGNSTITSWTWNFGDGNTGSGSCPTHVYATSGYFNVTLTVTNQNHCSDDTTITVYVDPGQGPQILCPGTVCAHSQQWYYTLYIPGAIYSWTVTGGVGTPTTNGDSIHVIWGAGTVGTITLSVSNTTYYTCVQPVTVNVPVFPTNPSILGPTVVCPGSTDVYTAPLMPGSLYNWSVTGDSFHTVNGNTLSVTWGHTPMTGSIILHMKNSLICCRGDDTIYIIKKPELHISGSNIACSGQTYTYNLPTGVTGNWACSGGNINTSYTGVNSVTITWGPAGPGVISVIPSVSGVYCNPVAMLNVTIMAPPMPANISGPSPVCIGSTHTYTANMQPGVVTSTWSVSPGSNTIITQTSTSADIKFNTAGPAVITLTQVNAAGCSTVTVYNVYVVPSATPSISGPLSACVHDIKMYTFTSSAPAGTYQWSITGGSVVSGYGNDTLQVQWGFSSGGTVTLNNMVCGTSTSIHVNIFDTPSLHIDTSGLTCNGTSITLNATPGCSAYVWSNAMTGPSITVTSPGTYSVTAYTPGSSCSNTATITLTSIPSLPKPVAAIAVTAMAAPPSLSPMWQLSASPSGPPGYTYLWNNSATTQSIFVHTAGTYSVVVTNIFGCSDTAFATITIDTAVDSGNCVIFTSNPCPSSGNVTLTAGAGTNYQWSTSATTQSISVPAGTYSVTYINTSGDTVSCSTTVAYTITPSFTVPSPVCNTVSFTNTTSGAAVAYLWDFGDGAYSNAFNGSHNYLTTGTYTVTLNVENAAGCWTSVSHSVTINVIINPSFTVSTSCNPTLSFTNTSAIQTNTTVSYAWNFGDPASGASNTATSINPSHTFTSAGPYTVTLTISSGGCTSTITHTVIAPQLTAIFSHCSIACLGQSTQFLDLSIHTSPIVSWAWDFGNGNLSTLQNPWNVYTTAGFYTIKLVIMDSKGCKDSTTTIVNVSGFSPGILTITGDTILCAGDSVQLSAPAGYSYIWSNGATNQSIYAHLTDNYSVTVVNANGCTKILGPVQVISHPRPVASISLSGPNTICAGTSLNLQATAGTGYTYSWYHDGTLMPWYSSYDNIWVSSVYDSGVYTVVVTNAFGCKDSSAPVTIHVKPSPTVYITATTLCHWGTATLTAVDLGTAPIASYLWTGGGTGTSITVNQPGNYTLTVTGTNGCTYTTNYNVSYAPLPDLSLMPKGCYTICRGYTAVVQAPSGYTYQWYNGNTPAGNTASISISTSGTYWVIVTDAYGCADTSDKFTVNVVPGPVAVITPSGSPVLCNNNSGSVTLTAGGGTGYQYQWSTGETTQSIVVTHPGTYWVIVKINDCCESRDSIVIEGVNCCFPPGTIFTTIPDGYVVPTSQVWSGKYFIAGKVHVINHSILDLTEVDLVFDSTGEIIFHDTTIIRANNSVLRPCDMNKTWVGVTFKDLSRGIVHTTLFKNAEIALNVVNKDTFSVKSVDNSFVQCHVGIYINKNGKSYVEGITGNSFVIDNTKLPFINNDYFGIQLNNTFMREIISQNSFRNSSKEGQYKNFYGIFAATSSAMISTNTFTDMHRSIDVLRPIKYFSIENNTIEMTQSRTPNDYQIRVESNGVPHLIYNNQIFNSLPGLSTGTAAIYVNKSSLMNIKENHIKGFEYGIEMLASTYSQIIENNVENAQKIGIYYNDGVKGSPDNVDIACNEVNMDLQPGQVTVLPVGIAAVNADRSTQIRTNCVFNTCHGILVLSTFNEQIPVIKNNYLYNYTFAGIRNVGHFGDIGNSSTVFANAGRNTFVRNNYTSTDILSAPGINEGGNYGIQATIGVTSLGAQDKFNSTASCGLQINYPKKVELDDIAICDHFAKDIYPFMAPNLVKEGDFALSVDKQALDASPEDQTLSRLSGILLAVSNPDNMANAKSFYDMVTAAGYLRGNDQAWFNYDYQYLSGDFAKAAETLGNITPANTDEAERKQVETIRLNTAANPLLAKALPDPDKQLLSNIDNRRGIYAAHARDMLQMNAADHDYIFTLPYLPQLSLDMPEQHLIDHTDDNMEAYPNPVHDMLYVKYSTSYDGPQQVKLVDVCGKTLQSVPTAFTAAEMQVNVTGLAPGVYLLYLTQGQKVHRIKFVKD